MPDRGDGWRGATVDGQPVGGAYLVDGVLVGPDGVEIKKK
jgi:hypothetical protein